MAIPKIKPQLKLTEPQTLSHVYTLLGKLWLQEVDAPFLSALQRPPLSSAFQAVGGAIPTADSLDDLSTEYCRLFIGPKNHLPPLQSVWQRGELQSDITTSVQKFAEALHYEPPSAWPETMMDHLGIELLLMGQATSLLSPGATTEASDSYQFASTFFAQHLLWTDRFLTATSKRATLPFYKSLAQVTVSFLKSEQHVWHNR
jgi:TorA maturation chaperone TorD